MKAARDQYTYKQSVVLEEMDDHGRKTGEYRERREVIFSPQQERTDRMVGKPVLNLKRLILTEEDFHDLRDIQPFVMTEDQLWNYETKFRGDENIDGVDCWVLQVRPRQILSGQRLFDGMLWADKRDYSIVRIQGQAVPQILSTKEGKENLFPRFTTVRQPVDGKNWFPVVTYANDTLYFRGGAVGEKLTVRYSEYKRFGAESKVTFEK